MTDVYIGTELKKGSTKFDSDEYIDMLYVSVDEAVKMIYDGKIVDSKTIVALFAYKEMKSTGII